MQEVEPQGIQVAWHNVLADASLESLQTTDTGLSASEVGSRLETYGANRLPEAAKLIL